MNVREAALRAAVLKVLSDRIREEYDAARIDIHQALVDVLAESGVAGKVTVNLDGQPIATVSLTGGKPSARVVDEAAFLAWVRKTHPTEIEERVRPAFTKTVLDAGGIDGNGELADGVDVHAGTPYVSTRFTPDGRAAVAAAWQAGRLVEITGQAAALEAAP